MIVNVVSLVLIIIAMVSYYSSVRSKNKLLVVQANYIEALKKELVSLKSQAEALEALYKAALILNTSYRQKHSWNSK